MVYTLTCILPHALTAGHAQRQDGSSGRDWRQLVQLSETQAADWLRVITWVLSAVSALHQLWPAKMHHGCCFVCAQCVRRLRSTKCYQGCAHTD
jgi:hypothetical protein